MFCTSHYLFLASLLPCWKILFSLLCWFTLFRPLDAVDLGIHSWPVYLFTPRVVSLFHGVSYHLCVNDTQIYISNLISLPEQQTQLPEQQTQTIIYSMAKDILPKTAAPTHSSVIPISENGSTIH